MLLTPCVGRGIISLPEKILTKKKKLLSFFFSSVGNSKPALVRGTLVTMPNGDPARVRSRKARGVSPMRLAVIPARGGSKRIPRKNIKLFHGKPMIGYAITAAIASGSFDKVIVSTDDEEIAVIAGECGAEVPFLRPPRLADDHTPTVPVIAHAIKACQSMGWNVQEVCCVYPSVPFISTHDLRSAYEQLMDNCYQYVFPVTPIQRALRRKPDGSITPFQPEYAATRSQDLEPGFFDVGQFYWGKASAWLQGLNLHLNGITLVIPEWRVVDIDTVADWERAELLYALLLEKGLL